MGRKPIMPDSVMRELLVYYPDYAAMCKAARKYGIRISRRRIYARVRYYMFKIVKETS